MTRNATAARSHDKSNGGDRVVKLIRVYASGRVSAVGRPPKGWTDKGRAHALPNEDGPAATPAPAATPVPKAKNPAKVAAGKARAAQAKARKDAEAAGRVFPAPAPVAKPAAKKAAKPAAKKTPAKAASKPKAKPAAKAKAKTPAKRGGARAGTGPKPANGDAMVVAAFRVTKAQKAKLAKLGAEWLRARIDAATVK